MKLLNRSNKKDKIKMSMIDQEYYFFISYIRSLTTSPIDRVTLFRTLARKISFPNIAKIIRRISILSEKWRYGQAAACEAVSKNLKSKLLKTFLFKLAQSIRAGEPIEDFVEREYKSYMNVLPEQNRLLMQRLKTLADAYASFFTSGIFLTVTFLLAASLTNMINAAEVLVLAVTSLAVSLSVITILIFNTAKPEDILNDDKIKPKIRIIINLISIVSLVLSSIIMISGILLYPNYVLIFTGIPLLISGFIGKKYVDKVKKREVEYQTFLRNFMAGMGGGTSTTISLKNALLVKYAAGLEKLLNSLYSKLVFRINPRIAWNTFEIEVDSKLIRNINEIIIDVIYEGGDIDKVSKIIDHAYTTFLELRNRRYQIVSYLKGLLIPLHGVMGILFGVIGAFFSILWDFMSVLQLSINLVTIPNLDFLNYFFLFSLTLFSIANAMALYFMEGDSRYSFLMYIGLFLSLGGFSYVLSHSLTERYLSSIRF